MSIVIAVANMSRVVVKCDGLAHTMDTGEIESQDYERMVHLNHNCIVGYTGTNKLCEAIIDEYRRLAANSMINMNDLMPTTITYDLCELSKVINADNAEISFLVTGNENNRIVLFGFTSKDGYEINNFSPEDEEHIKYITLGIDNQSEALQYAKYYNVDKSIEMSMNRYIKNVSSLSPHINDHIFTKKINTM